MAASDDDRGAVNVDMKWTAATATTTATATVTTTRTTTTWGQNQNGPLDVLRAGSRPWVRHHGGALWRDVQAGIAREPGRFGAKAGPLGERGRALWCKPARSLNHEAGTSSEHEHDAQQLCVCVCASVRARAVDSPSRAMTVWGKGRSAVSHGRPAQCQLRFLTITIQPRLLTCPRHAPT